MKNNIVNWFEQECAVPLILARLMTALILFTPQPIEAALSLIHPYLLNNINIVHGTQLYLQNLTPESLGHFVGTTLMVEIHGLMMFKAWIKIIVFLWSFAIFHMIKKILSLKYFGLKGVSSAIIEMRLIMTWMLLYSNLNLLIDSLVTKENTYLGLTALCQGVVFFLLVYNNAYGYKLEYAFNHKKSS